MRALPDWNGVLMALGSWCPRVEHLKLAPWLLSPTATISVEAMLRLERLVSIKMQMRYWDGSELVDWRWLEALAEKGQLEYLYVRHPDMLFELMCTVVGKCKVIIQR